MPINHAHLRAFHAVATEGSFTRAARAVHLTQPTLSGQVKALEERYQVRLLDRRSRGVRLTELGRSLHDLTQRQALIHTEIERLLTTARGLLSGHLRVSADAPYHVIPLLAAFNRAYPSIRFSLELGNSETVLQRVLDQRCDVAVLPTPRVDPRLHVLRLEPDELVAFVAADHAWATRRSVALTDLDGQRLVLRERGSSTRAIFERAAVQGGVTLNDVLEIGSREGVHEAVAAGLGVGIVARSELGRDERVHALQLRDAQLENNEELVCLRERRHDVLVNAFLEVVVADGGD